MTGSLAFRKNEGSIRKGFIPQKYTRLLPLIPGDRIIEIGSAEGVLSLLLAKDGREVTAVERDRERHDAALSLYRDWQGIYRFKGMPDFVNGSIVDHLGLLDGQDTLVAVRMIYYLGQSLDTVFAEVSRHVPNVVLCGNGNRACRWREGIREETKADNYYASREGMKALLKRHGYRIVHEVTNGDEIVVGRKDG